MIRAATWLAIVGSVVLLAALAYSILVHEILDGEVTAESLAWSVADEAGSAGELLGEEPECERRGAAWKCTMVDSGGSGGATYRVRVRPGSSCWDGRLSDRPGEPMPGRISACIHRADER